MTQSTGCRVSPHLPCELASLVPVPRLIPVPQLIPPDVRGAFIMLGPAALFLPRAPQPADVPTLLIAPVQRAAIPAIGPFPGPDTKPVVAGCVAGQAGRFVVIRHAETIPRISKFRFALWITMTMTTTGVVHSPSVSHTPCPTHRIS
ncbi:hypothetical protein ACFWP7_05745 [Streptomyces sp. NPDC058470]|uniref:hypothetical protein n=1 Tax=Streptomyces sp. NPDC058470 TaxID=3346515 RepID=UPI00364998E7